jgi:hypothetical protein
MKTFRCDISSLYGSQEIEELSDILYTTSYLTNLNKLDNLQSIPSKLADIVGPFLGTCFYSPMSQDTYVEMIRKSNAREKKVLGENVWKYIVQSDPSLLRFAMSEYNFSLAVLNMEERVSMVTKCYDVFNLVDYDPDTSVELAVKVLQENPRASSGCNKELKKAREVAKMVPDIVKKYRHLINEVPPDQRTGSLEIIASPFCVPNFPLKDGVVRKLLAITHLQPGSQIKKILDACAFGTLSTSMQETKGKSSRCILINQFNYRSIL